MNTLKVDPDNHPDAEVARRIKNALKVEGINQEDLVARTGISLSTLRRSLEQERPDRRSLSLKQFYKISDALDVTPSVLLPAPRPGDAD